MTSRHTGTKPRFVQITTTGVENGQSTQCNWILHALDSDGRIWELDDQHGWREVPLPTPESDDHETLSK